MFNSDRPTARRPNESPRAFEAFSIYVRLPARERSIDAAWRASPKVHQKCTHNAPRHWKGWSVKFEWPARAAAYDDYLADQDRLIWEERRRLLRERDWKEGESLRNIVRDALPTAAQFVRSGRTLLKGENGGPDREIITLAFDVTALARALALASKLQRLAADEATEHLQLSGAALDAAISRELASIVGAGKPDAAYDDELIGDG